MKEADHKFRLQGKSGALGVGNGQLDADATSRLRGRKFLYLGNGYFAATLLRLMSAWHDQLGIISFPDRVAGRGKKAQPTDVAQVANEFGLPLCLLDDKQLLQQQIRALAPDMLIVCDFSMILPRAILRLLPYGAINVHPSLLPLYRGASPIQSAILAGESHSGVSLFLMDSLLDSGPIIAQQKVKINQPATSGTLSLQLVSLAAHMLLQILNSHPERDFYFQAHSQSTYCTLISKAEAKIDFTAAGITQVRKIMAMDPNPYAYCMHKETRWLIKGASLVEDKSVVSTSQTGETGQILAVDKAGLLVKCADGVILLEKIKPAGKKRFMHPLDMINGRMLKVGDVLV